MNNTLLKPEAPTQRRGRGRGKSQKSLDLVNAAKQILEEIQPATVRAVCYRLFTASLIPNMSKNSTDKVSKQLVWARESGLIPWRWIVDETRHAERSAVWDSIDERITQATTYYRRDNWQEQPHALEVWSEKGTVRGTIWPVLSAYGVTFRVMHGFGSATALNHVATMSAYSIKPLIVLYVGDFDCSGMCMSEVDIPQRIARYNGQVAIRRIALTDNDVRPGTELPHFDADTKSGDSRYKWFVSRYGRKCWELDAMSPVVLRERVESAIVDMLDMDAWNHAKAIEQVEVASMRDYQKHWKESISRQADKCSSPTKKAST
ncbi:MAG: hypothetical protein KDJ34_04005 [Candidatus Competibacteraceae bacterium]|nr:hypothetical protein [Candidatus Competibacteraceae bacterium]